MHTFYYDSLNPRASSSLFTFFSRRHALVHRIVTVLLTQIADQPITRGRNATRWSCRRREKKTMKEHLLIQFNTGAENSIGGKWVYGCRERPTMQRCVQTRSRGHYL